MKKRSSTRRILLLGVVLALVASGCYTWTSVVNDPGKALAAEWYAAVPVEKGHVTACDEAYSTQFEGQGWQCRSVWGVEDAGDHGNWHVDPGGPGDISNDGILSMAGKSSSSRGVTLVMEDGNIFEGCSWRSPDNTWFCDYKSRMWSVPFKTTQGINYLRATVDFSFYVVDAVACAGGLTGSLMYGQVWTLPAMKDCGSGPL